TAICPIINEWQLSFKLVKICMEFTQEVKQATDPIYQK
mgnify:CR=1